MIDDVDDIGDDQDDFRIIVIIIIIIIIMTSILLQIDGWTDGRTSFKSCKTENRSFMKRFGKMLGTYKWKSRFFVFIVISVFSLISG